MSLPQNVARLFHASRLSSSCKNRRPNATSPSSVGGVVFYLNVGLSGNLMSDTEKGAAVAYRDRIKELRRVPAADLLENAKNWRKHPERQKNAMTGVLRDIGYADAALARELDDGTLVLIDGHLRKDTAGETPIPVLILDVTEEEADKILATHDPLCEMAAPDFFKFAELDASISFDDEHAKALMSSMLGRTKQREDFDAKRKRLPESWDLIINCEDADQQRQLYDELSKRGLSLKLSSMEVDA